MTFLLGSVSQGNTFLKWICMSPNNLFAVIGIQYYGELVELKTTTVVTGDITQSQSQ